MEYKHSCVIDAEKRYKTNVLVHWEPDPETQELQEKIQFYTLLAGEKLVDAKPPVPRRCAGADGFVRPRWDEMTTWMEGATAEEIAAWEETHPAPETAASAPSATEQLRADVDYLAVMTGVRL